MSYFGSDPELAIQAKGQRVGHAISIHEVPNREELTNRQTSDDRVEVSRTGEAWLITDGWAVEINTKASSCRDFHVPGIAAALRDFYNRYPDFKLSAVPKVKLRESSVKGNVPPGVNEFGCLPDLDAYEVRQKTPPTSEYPDRYRYAGGHIHLSINSMNPNAFGAMKGLTEEDRQYLGSAYTLVSDLWLGVPLVAMIGNVNDYGESDRRSLYGQAGSFRLKEYGIEYRVPSSAIMMSPVFYSWVLGQMKQLTNARKQIGSFGRTFDDEGRFVFSRQSLLADVVQMLRNFDGARDIINDHDVEKARWFVNQHQQFYRKMYERRFYDLMLEADDANIGFNPNLFESWELHKPIYNHFYSGNECLFNIREDGTVKASYYNHCQNDEGVDHTGFTKAAIPFIDLIPKLPTKPVSAWAVTDNTVRLPDLDLNDVIVDMAAENAF